MWFNYSLLINDNLSSTDPRFWNRPTPISCDAVRITGIILCTSALLGVMLNSLLLYSFIRYQALRTSSNIYVMFIAILGLVASCTILPLTGTSSIYCRWLYTRIGCQLSAAMAFVYGCSSSYLLCAVSLCRCYIIVRPFNANAITVSNPLGSLRRSTTSCHIGQEVDSCVMFRRARSSRLGGVANARMERVHDGGLFPPCRKKIVHRSPIGRSGCTHVVLHQLVRSAILLRIVHVLSLRRRLLHSVGDSDRLQLDYCTWPEKNARQDRTRHQHLTEPETHSNGATHREE